MSPTNEAITALLHRYATAIDTKDWTLFRSCFTADAVTDYGDIGQWSDVDGITDFMIAAHDGMRDTKHMLHNVVIDVRDRDNATAVTYVHTVQSFAHDPTQWIDAVGQYSDEIVHTEEGWRIARRVFQHTRMFTSYDIRQQGA